MTEIAFGRPRLLGQSENMSFPAKTQKYLNTLNSERLSSFVYENFQIDSFSVSDRLRRMSLEFKSTDTKYFFANISDEHLLYLFNNPIVTLSKFLELYLLPTSIIFELYLNNNIELIKNSQEDIRCGKFKQDNPLHIELEYSRYLLSSQELFKKYREISFEKFSQIPKCGEVILTPEEEKEVESIGQDNANIYSYIQKLSQKRNVLVIFNRRYGEYYTGRILHTLLSKNPRVKMGNSYIPSTGVDDDSRDFPNYKKKQNGLWFLTDEEKQYIEHTQADVLILDGTISTGLTNKPRFPGSMRVAIYELQEKLKNYNLKFYIPDKGEVHTEVSVGIHGEYQETIKKEEGPSIYIIRTNGASRGFFDDPEKISDKTILQFGNYGLVEQRRASSEGILLKILIDSIARVTQNVIIL